MIIDSITTGQVFDVCCQLLPSVASVFVVRLLTNHTSAVLAFGSSLAATLLILFGPIGHIYSDLRMCHHHSNFTGLQYSGIDRAIYNTLSAHKAIKHIALQSRLRSVAHSVLNKISITPISQQPLNVILILGESARRSSMHWLSCRTPYADSSYRLRS